MQYYEINKEKTFDSPAVSNLVKISVHGKSDEQKYFENIDLAIKIL